MSHQTFFSKSVCLCWCVTRVPSLACQSVRVTVLAIVPGRAAEHTAKDTVSLWPPDLLRQRFRHRAPDGECGRRGWAVPSSDQQPSRGVPAGQPCRNLYAHIRLGLEKGPGRCEEGDETLILKALPQCLEYVEQDEGKKRHLYQKQAGSR